MAKKPSPDVKFKYGECKTDHKPGDEIRAGFRSTDYMKDEPYAAQVQDMLEQLGLPQPKKNEIFRGTHHDLLFLDSHGVVLRIGPTDVEDLMNPAVIQPLGWLENKDQRIRHGANEIPFTIAVYPGIELYNDFQADKKQPETAAQLYEFMQETGQNTSDLSRENIGIIRVKDDSGKEVAVEMLLDPDNSYNASNADTSQTKTSRFANAQKDARHKGEALEATLNSMFENAKNVDLYRQAFAVHQPLRDMFWQAFDGADQQGGKPDSNRRSGFWNACAKALNNPTTHFHKTATYRLEGNTVRRSPQTSPVETVLYRPWTGNRQDSVASVKRKLENAKKPLLPRLASKFVDALMEGDDRSAAAKRQKHLPKPLRRALRIGKKLGEIPHILFEDIPDKVAKRIDLDKGADKIAKAVNKQWKKIFKQNRQTEAKSKYAAASGKNASQKTPGQKSSAKASSARRLSPPSMRV